jgi:hypothetical protein
MNRPRGMSELIRWIPVFTGTTKRMSFLPTRESIKTPSLRIYGLIMFAANTLTNLREQDLYLYWKIRWIPIPYHKYGTSFHGNNRK